MVVRENKIVNQLLDTTAELLRLGKKPKIIGYSDSRTCQSFKLELCDSQLTPRRVIAILYKTRKAEDAIHNPSENVYNSLLKLAQLNARVPVPKLVIPRPIAKLPEMNGVIMEYVDGTTFDTYMRASFKRQSYFKKRRQILTEYFRSAGELIGLIHAETSKPDVANAKFYFESKMEAIKSKIRKSHFNNLKIFRETLMLLNEVASTISWKRNSCSLIHGDFVHNNLIITADGKIAIIDWAESRLDSPYHDLSRFTVRTILDYGDNPKCRSNFLTDLNHNFLNSYFCAHKKLKANNELYCFYCIFNTLQFISFLCEGLRNYLSCAFIKRDLFALFLLNQYIKQLRSGKQE